MASTRDASGAAFDVLAKGLTDIRNLVGCKICTRLMFEPYTTKCGHTFCYGCLSKWLNHGEQRRQCPDCRARIREEPGPDFTIRNIVHVLVSNSSYLDDGDTTETLQEEQQEQADILETDRANASGLFKGLFRQRYQDPILDDTDGVMRCPSCNWEVEDNYCGRCDLDFGDGSLASFSDYMEDEDFEGHSIDGLSDIPNEEDEAFIDDAIPPYLYPNGGDLETPGQIPGTYMDPYELDSDSDEFPEDVAEQFHDAQTGSQATQSDTETSNLGSAEVDDDDGISEDDSDATSDESGSDSASTSAEESEDDSDDEPVRPVRIIRQNRRFDARARPSLPLPPHIRRGNVPPSRTNVVDLTAQEDSSNRRSRAQPARPPLFATLNNNGGSNSATNDTNRQSDGETSEESELEAPIALRPRKRERIVLDDSDEEDGVTVQRETRARRRRLAHSTTTTYAATNRYRPSVTDWIMDTTNATSTLPPIRSRLSRVGLEPSVYPGPDQYSIQHDNTAESN